MRPTQTLSWLFAVVLTGALSSCAEGSGLPDVAPTRIDDDGVEESDAAVTSPPPVEVATLLSEPLGGLPDEEALFRALPGAWERSPCEVAHAVLECRVLELVRPGLEARAVVVPDKDVMVERLVVERDDVALALGLRVGLTREAVATLFDAPSLASLEDHDGIRVEERRVVLSEDLAPQSLTLSFDEEGVVTRIEYQGYVD